MWSRTSFLIAVALHATAIKKLVLLGTIGVISVHVVQHVEKELSKKPEHVKMGVQVKLVAPEMQYSRSLVMKNHANVRLDLNVHPIKSLVSVLLMLTNIALHRHVGLTKTTLKLESLNANLRPRKSANALCT